MLGHLCQGIYARAAMLEQLCQGIYAMTAMLGKLCQDSYLCNNVSSYKMLNQCTVLQIAKSKSGCQNVVNLIPTKFIKISKQKSSFQKVFLNFQLCYGSFVMAAMLGQLCQCNYMLDIYARLALLGQLSQGSYLCNVSAPIKCNTRQSLTGSLQGRISTQADPCSHYREWVLQSTTFFCFGYIISLFY